MLHLVVLAMITASDLNSSVASAPAAKLEHQLSGAAFDSGSTLDTNGGFDQIIKICTYGTPPLGSNPFGDASGLMRTMTTPSCADGTNDLQSTFATQRYPVLLTRAISPAVTLLSPGVPVQLAGSTVAMPRHVVGALTSFSGAGHVTRLPQRVTGTPVESSRVRSEHTRR